MPAIPQTQIHSPATLVRRVIIYSSGGGLPTWAIGVIIAISVLSFGLSIYNYIRRKEKKERLRREITDLRAQVNGAPPPPQMANTVPVDGYKNNYTYNSQPATGMPAAPAQTYAPNHGTPEITGNPSDPEMAHAAAGLNAVKEERSKRWF